MKIPKKVKIGPHTYNIKFRDDIDDHHLGTCRVKNLSIFINGSAAKSMQEETFIHECLHAIVYSLGMYSSGQYNEEEQLVQSISHAFYQLLSENKLLK